MFNTMLTDSLRFTALSYVWGDANATEDVIVNGTPFKVTTNLASALRHIRATDVGMVMDAFWVDAICINQSDIPEKSHQVSFMGSIFRSATLVVGWLGPETENSARALDLVHRISLAYQSAKTREDLAYGWLEKLPEFWRPAESSEEIHDIPEAVSLLEMLEWNDLFWRAWIFQETVLARFEIFMYGEDAMVGEELWSCVEFFQDLVSAPTHLKPYFMDIELWALLRTPPRFSRGHVLNETRHKLLISGCCSLPLLSLLRETMVLEVKILHDKVYSLLGLTTDQITVEYDKPLERLLVEVVEIHLRNSRALDFLLLACNHEKVGAQPLLRSWLPTVFSPSSFVYSRQWPGSVLCGGYDSVEARVMADRGSIVSRGLPVELGAISTQVTLSWECVHGLLRDALLEQPRQYPTGIPWLQALVRTVMGVFSGDTTPLCSTEPLSLAGVALFRLFRDNESVSRDGKNLLKGDQGMSYFQERYFGAEYLAGRDWRSSFDASIERSFMNRIFEALVEVSSRRQFFITTEIGYLGFSVNQLEHNDTIVILPGFEYLVALRKVDSHYIFVSLCWILGFMNGEAMENVGDTDFQTFEIR